jgi:hypothetical protein
MGEIITIAFLSGLACGLFFMLIMYKTIHSAFTECYSKKISLRKIKN